MRSIALFLFGMLSIIGRAQSDTLLWQDFEDPLFMDVEVTDSLNAPLNMWLNLDIDLAQDANNRPKAWFSGFAFSSIDSGNRVLQSSSWLSDTTIRTENWFVSPLIMPEQGESILIQWMSAPRQTPEYLDGYRVMWSSTGRDPEDFITLKVLSEHLGPSIDSSGMGVVPTYNWFEFSGGGDIHGFDGQNIQLPSNSDSTAFIGELWRPELISLPNYSHDTLFLAFVHDSKNDNLISIDDILLLGTDASSIEENKLEASIQMFPNPATTILNVEYELTVSTEVNIVITDMQGRTVAVQNLGDQVPGTYETTQDVSNFAAGAYNMTIEAMGTSFTKNFVVK